MLFKNLINKVQNALSTCIEQVTIFCVKCKYFFYLEILKVGLRSFQMSVIPGGCWHL